MTNERIEQVRKAIVNKVVPLSKKAEYARIFECGVAWADENPVNPWISVEERLPEIDREVYLYHYGHFEIARRVICKDRIYNRDGTHSDTIEWKISHGTSYSDISEGDYWMPIPELPK